MQNYINYLKGLYISVYMISVTEGNKIYKLLMQALKPNGSL